MCGYIGGTKKVLLKNDIEELLLTQIHRGIDGYGAIALYEDGSSEYLKDMKPEPIEEWVKELKGNPFVIIHHRATSVGGTNLKLAHPLEYGDIILMQNGTNKDPYMMVEKSESDSEALAILASIMEPDDFEKYILSNVGVVFFRKNGKLYLHKDSTRPLAQHTTGLIASEPLTDGEWREFKDGFYELSYSNGKLQGPEFKDFVDIDDIGLASKCSKCKKEHLVPFSGTICTTCILNGATQKKDSASLPYPNSSKHLPDVIDAYTVGDDSKVKVYEIVESDVKESGQFKVVRGYPMQIDGNYYLVPVDNPRMLLGKTANFLTKEVFRDSSTVYEYWDGYVPYTTLSSQVVLSLADFLPYYNKEKGYYTLITDTYYADEYLEDEDKAYLVYDNNVGEFIIPLTYEYSPSSQYK